MGLIPGMASREWGIIPGMASREWGIIPGMASQELGIIPGMAPREWSWRRISWWTSRPVPGGRPGRFLVGVPAGSWWASRPVPGGRPGRFLVGVPAGSWWASRPVPGGRLPSPVVRAGDLPPAVFSHPKIDFLDFQALLLGGGPASGGFFPPKNRLFGISKPCC